MANSTVRDLSPVLIATVAISTAALLVVQFVFLAPAPQPRTGALLSPERLSVETVPTVSFGEHTTVHLTDQRYVFGPGRIASGTTSTPSDTPLVLGIGGTLMDTPDYALSTQVGVGRMLNQDDLSLGESVTHLAGQLTRDLNDKLALQADYRVLEGDSTHTEDWAVGFQYEINARAQWHIEHRESRDQTGQRTGEHETKMEYRLQF